MDTGGAHQVQHVAAHLDQESVQSSGVGLQDIYQVPSAGRFGPQPPDGPLHVRLVAPRAQDHQVLTGHAPCRLKTRRDLCQFFMICNL